jgi:hypothetical protein
MRSRRGWISVLSAVLLFSRIGAGAQVKSLEDLQATLSAHTVIRGAFKQIRTLEMFDQPLVSEGCFLLSEEHGLRWMQTRPIAVTLVLGSDQLSQQFADQPEQIMKAEDNSMMFHFSRLFLSIFRGETAGLEEQFDIKFSPAEKAEENWSLKLSPKKDPLRAAFKMISLHGSDYINYIRLEETSGDVFEIHFSDQRSQPVALTEDERSAF